MRTAFGVFFLKEQDSRRLESMNIRYFVLSYMLINNNTNMSPPK